MIGGSDKRPAGESESKWETRWHPLREEWIIVAAHRQDRPWIGTTVTSGASGPPSVYEPDCYLCPGNRRVGGAINPEYTNTFVFDNDHPCVGDDAPDPHAEHALYKVLPARGYSRVVCYSPRHDQTLATMSHKQIDVLLATWQAQFRELSALSHISQVLIFENRGAAVGVSNPHPHCQIYATNFVFRRAAQERAVCRKYFEANGRSLLSAVMQLESEAGTRVIWENEHAVVFVPWFARYAYEAYVVPRNSHADITGLSDTERAGLAKALRQLVVRYDNLWRMPFPYVMTLQQAPVDGSDSTGYHFYIEFQPPMRKPHLLKHLAGPEIGGGNFVSDTWPEEKAAELRGVDGRVHYTEEGSSDG